VNNFLGGLPPEDVQRILALGTTDERAQRLRQKQAYGQALRSRSVGSFTNPYAAALGGVADLTNSLFGAYQQRTAAEGLEELSHESTRGRSALLNAYMGAKQRGLATSPNVIAPNIGMPDATPEQQAMATALRREQQQDAERSVREDTAHLGLLSGDQGLRDFSNALLRPDPSGLQDLQAMRLEQSAERLRLSGENARLGRDLAERRLGLMEDRTKTAKETAETKAAEKKVADQLKVEEGLRKEVFGNDIAKDYLKAQVAYDKVLNAAKLGTGAGDVALVFNLMKTLDPGSTVNSGEQASAANTTNIPGQLLNTYNRLLTGEKLNPEQRADFVRAAGTALAAQQSGFQRFVDAYRGIAQRAGADLADVLPLGAGPIPDGPAAPQRAPAAAAPASASAPTIDLSAPPASVVLPDGRRATRNPDGTYTTE
jgi:hypothetical protein